MVMNHVLLRQGRHSDVYADIVRRADCGASFGDRSESDFGDVAAASAGNYCWM